MRVHCFITHPFVVVNCTTRSPDLAFLLRNTNAVMWRLLAARNSGHTASSLRIVQPRRRTHDTRREEVVPGGAAVVKLRSTKPTDERLDVTGAVWSSMTVFVTDPQATGRIYQALGLPVREIDANLVEVPLKSGPTLRLVAAAVPTRTHTGFRVPHSLCPTIALGELGADWRVNEEGILTVKDPDGNRCYGVPPRGGKPPRSLAMWSMFVTDVAGTAQFLKSLLGPGVHTAQSRIGTVGDPHGVVLKEDVTFPGQDHTLTLLPAGHGRTTEASLGIEVPDLDAVAQCLGEGDWDYEYRTTETVVARTPDGNPIYFMSRAKTTAGAQRRRSQ